MVHSISAEMEHMASSVYKLLLWTHGFINFSLQLPHIGHEEGKVCLVCSMLETMAKCHGNGSSVSPNAVCNQLQCMHGKSVMHEKTLLCKIVGYHDTI